MARGTHRLITYSLLEEGYIVEVISGPHETRREAHYRADVAWEEPE